MLGKNLKGVHTIQVLILNMMAMVLIRLDAIRVSIILPFAATFHEHMGLGKISVYLNTNES